MLVSLLFSHSMMCLSSSLHILSSSFTPSLQELKLVTASRGSGSCNDGQLKPNARVPGVSPAHTKKRLQLNPNPKVHLPSFGLFLSVSFFLELLRLFPLLCHPPDSHSHSHS